MMASDSINFLSILSVHLHMYVFIYHLFSVYPQRCFLGVRVCRYFYFTCEVTVTTLATAENRNATGRADLAAGRAAG